MDWNDLSLTGVTGIRPAPIKKIAAPGQISLFVYTEAVI